MSEADEAYRQHVEALAREQVSQLASTQSCLHVRILCSALPAE